MTTFDPHMLLLIFSAAVVTYLTRSEYPIPGIEQWNLLIGFVLIIAGFGMTTRWR